MNHRIYSTADETGFLAQQSMALTLALLDILMALAYLDLLKAWIFLWMMSWDMIIYIFFVLQLMIVICVAANWRVWIDWFYQGVAAFLWGCCRRVSFEVHNMQKMRDDLPLFATQCTKWLFNVKLGVGEMLKLNNDAGFHVFIFRGILL